MTQSGGIDVAVSTVILTLRRTDDGSAVLALPLVLRTREPFADQWALPGGWLTETESPLSLIHI